VSLQLLLHKLKSSIQTHHGQPINSSNVAQPDSAYSETTAFNVPPHCSGMPPQEDAPHAHPIISITQPPRDANALFHVKPQDNTAHRQDNANAQSTKKVTREFGALLTRLANAHQNYHSGTVNTVSFAQLELNSILKKNNVITVQKDLREITPATHVFQDFETNDLFIWIFIKEIF
jgi:hypothetical protein